IAERRSTLAPARPRLGDRFDDRLAEALRDRVRVCVIGDAVHATSPSAGHGASLALEDAMMLGRCLRDAGFEPERAFAMPKRRARVESVVKQPRRNGAPKAPANAFAAGIRDLLLPVFVPLGTSAQHTLYARRRGGRGLISALRARSADWKPRAARRGARRASLGSASAGRARRGG